MAEFFAKNLRFQKKEKKTPLQMCWCAATIKNFSSSDSKEIDSVDIAAVCDELKNKFLKTQGKSRCSLYYASQLMFGAVKVFQAQTDSCSKASQNICESFILRAEIKKKTKKRKDNKHVEDNDSAVEASPKMPEIPEIDIFSLLQKDSAKDVNLIEEIDFPPDHTNDLSFEFSNDAEWDDVAMEEELNRKLQRILRQEKNIPPSRHSADSPLHETQHISGNENVMMDQDQIPLNENHMHNDMRRKLQKTPIRKARPILMSDINESTPASARAVFSPLASRAPSLPQSPLFVMSPVLRKRKKRPLSALGRDATIMEPIAEAALPTDSPQQSRLPVECATPPRLFSTTLGEHQAFENDETTINRQSNIQPEQEKESSLENDEAVKSTLGNKSASLPAESEGSVKSLSQNIARSQKVTAKSTDKNVGRRRAKKRIFQDSEKKLDDRDFAKRLKNINYSVKKKEKVLITSTISSQSSAARFLFTLPSVPQKNSSISNRLMQLYEQDIRVLKKSAKEPVESQHSSQQSENQSYNQNYNEEEILHQSPAEAVVEENMEPPQINQYFEDDGMMPQDNVLNKQCLPVQTEVQMDYVNEDGVQDNISDSAVATSSIPARVNSSQSTVAASVGRVSPSASLNKENDQVFHRPASPCIPIQSNHSQFFEPSQTVQINEVSEEVDDRQQESDQVLHPSAKRFKVGETELGIDLTVQNLKTISYLSLKDFYARVEKFWNKAVKLNRRINGKVLAVFQEVVSPECSNLYEVLKYLIYCFMLEQKRKMDLHQQKPWDPLYILQRK